MGPSFLHAYSEDSDQTGRMHSHFVGFVMSQLKCLTSLCNEAIVILYRSFINDI